MFGCCGCCSALRPRYKRLVDNIFPVDPQDGLVKANMDKLTFYSLSSPEKLDRIGEYLFQRASRDIYRRRYGFVIIAMEAMDRLLKASHAKTLNLFGESFLKMVQKLLESSEPKLQILATQSFVHFANIEEDTPSYHRRYDFFVSKFSSMCHSNHDDVNVRDSLRLAGIQGLQGVVRKTVSDDLVENIWNKQHMDKIVPSLLFNMQNAPDNEADCNPPQIQDDPDPPTLAEACLRELVGRASFGHIHSVIKPVLRHLDNHQLWVPNTFAIKTFRIIMFSIQAQYSYTVVEALMNHLDQNSESNPQIRTSIADVLSKIIAIAAGESVGPSVLEIINSLLSNLRKSVSRTSDPNPVESQYQEALINALGEFANHLPDYQKIEIMMFIMNKVPYPCNDMLGSDTMLQNILLKSLLKVGTKYKSVHLDKTFQLSFLDPLLRMARASDPKMRVLVQNILHTLIDRHNNLNKLSVASVKIQSRDLVLEQSSRPDLIFINKHGPAIYNSLYASLLLDETDVECINATYTTLSLLCVELSSADTATDIIQLLMGIQQMALTNKPMALPQRYNLLALTIALLYIIPQVLSIPALQEYTKKLIEARRAEASYLLPPLLDVYEPGLIQSPTSLPHLMIDQLAVCECLKAVGIDVSRLQQPSPYGNANANITMAHRHSWVEAGTSRGSITDLSSFNNDVDSVSSSPGVQRSKSESFPYRSSMASSQHNFLINWYEERSSISGSDQYRPLKSNVKFKYVRLLKTQKSPGEGLNFESMKKALCEPQDSLKQMKEEQRKQIGRAFRQDSFNDLVKRTQPKHELLQNKLNDIFSSLDATKSIEQSRSDENSPQMKPAYEKHFPELFIH